MSSVALISLYGVENVGVRTMASVLSNSGHRAHLIFFKRWLNNDIRFPSEEEKNILCDLLKELGIEIVGFSFTSPFLSIAKDLTLRIKAMMPALVVWGGIHATVKPQDCLSYCDAVCRGEGEYPMLDIADSFALGSSLKGIQNIGYKENGTIVLEALRPLIQDLDTIAKPAYGDNHIYFIEKKLYRKDPMLGFRELRVLASRGCPFQCSYCYNSILSRLYPSQKYHRIKSVESLLSEISDVLKKCKGIRVIKFDDDTFRFPKEWIDEFAHKFKKRIGLPFEILYRADCFVLNELRILKNAGLQRIQVGIETGSQALSKELFNRDLSLERIRQFSYAAHDLKLHVFYDVILDNPFESFKDKKFLIDFLLTLRRPFTLFLYSLTIFPGTEICDILLGKGLIVEKDIEGQSHKSFYQFRLSFHYPRTAEDIFVISILSFISKHFIPKCLIVCFKESRFFRKNPSLLRWFAEICNMVKLFFVFVDMAAHGTINLWKLKEYGMLKRLINQ